MPCPYRTSHSKCVGRWGAVPGLPSLTVERFLRALVAPYARSVQDFASQALRLVAEPPYAMPVPGIE
eukprot:193116-Rhodomonas_salina.4